MPKKNQKPKKHRTLRKSYSADQFGVTLCRRLHKSSVQYNLYKMYLFHTQVIHMEHWWLWCIKKSHDFQI